MTKYADCSYGRPPFCFNIHTAWTRITWVPIWLYADKYTSKHTHTCIHICAHACIHTSIIRTHWHYMHSCTHACMHAYIHTYIHTCIHTYIHTCTYKQAYSVPVNTLRWNHTCSIVRRCINKVLFTLPLEWSGKKSVIHPPCIEGGGGVKRYLPSVCWGRV